MMETKPAQKTTKLGNFFLFQIVFIGITFLLLNTFPKITECDSGLMDQVSEGSALLVELNSTFEEITKMT